MSLTSGCVMELWRDRNIIWGPPYTGGRDGEGSQGPKLHWIKSKAFKEVLKAIFKRFKV